MKKLIFLLSFCFGIILNVNSQCMLVCNNQINVSLDNNGQAVITPDMVLESTPNCTVEIGLFDSVNGSQIIPFGDDITLDCSHLGTYVYQVQEIGVGGNSCWAMVFIEDKLDACPLDIGQDSLGIVYRNSNGFGSFASETTLNGDPVEEIYDWLDVFAIADLVSGENVLSFGESANQNSANGISTLDVVVAQQALLEINTDYPLRAVLADVDDSGYLGVNDIVLIRQYILGIINELPAKDNVYFSNTYSFPVDFDIFDFTTENFREYRFDDADVTQDDLYFNVFKMADINGVTTPDSVKSETATNRSSKLLITEDRAVVKGELISVPMQLDAEDININGLQVSFNLSNLSLENIIDNYSGAQLIYNEISNTELRLSFLDDGTAQYFDITLQMEVLEDGRLSDMLSLNADFENIVASYTSHAGIEIAFENSSSTKEVLDVKGNVLSTSLEIYLPRDHNDAINVYDVQGKLISTHTPVANQVILDRGNFPVSGMYILSTVSNGKQIAKKLIVI